MDFLHTLFANPLVSFVILVGLVIFIHELGHFFAGKFFGIQVEEFSIGFGPKAFSLQRGTTVYRINWLPIGGYVRFYGADPSENIPLENKHKSFLHAKLYKRMIVSFAGPFANVILSLVIISSLYWKGLPAQPPIINTIPNSAAEKSGLKSGDRVISIQGKNVRSWSDLSKYIKRSRKRSLDFRVIRHNKIQTIVVTPQVENSETIYGIKKPTKKIGVTPYFAEPILVLERNSHLYKAGLRTGDRITDVNENKTKYFFQIQDNLNENINKKARIQWERSQKKMSMNITIQRHDSKDLLSPSLLIQDFVDPQKIKDEKKSYQDDIKKSVSAFQSCGFQKGDVITNLNNKTIVTNFDLYSFSESFSDLSLHSKTQKSPMQFLLKGKKFNANSQKVSFSCTVPIALITDHLDRKKRTILFPFEFASRWRVMPQTEIQSKTPLDNMNMSLEMLWSQITLIYHGIKHLFSGDIPLTNLGGPVAIAQIAHDAASAGIITFLLTMSIISVNIGMMNLLPLPGLDGGHLMLNTIELLYGKPLPQNLQTQIQRIGILFLLFLFVFVFYNDIMRLFGK